MYPKEFISKVLIKEIGEIKSHHPYLAFLLICSGIEFLGKCLSKNDWQEYSKEYFSNAIKDLFPETYQDKEIIELMRKDLRNGMVHALLPDSGVGLTEIKHDPDAEIRKETHPFKQGKKWCFMIEYLYIDFVDACREVIRRKKDESGKFNRKLLELPEETAGKIVGDIIKDDQI